MSKKVNKPIPKAEIIAEVVNNDIVNEAEKLMFIKYFFVFCISSIIFAVVANLFLNTYQSNIPAALETARNLLCVDGYAPEPKEKAGYFLSLVTFTFSFIGFLYLWNTKFQKTIKKENINNLFYTCLIIFIGCVAFVTYKGFTAKNPLADAPESLQDIQKTNWDFYFVETFIHTNLIFYSCVCLPIILFLFYKLNFYKNNLINKILNYGVAIYCGAIAFLLFFITSFSFPYTYENKYDFNAIFYSVVQVCHGVPMLVDGFTNTYGLYPHFVAPFLKIFGLNIQHFTIIMALLLSLCFVLLYFALKKYISNNLLLLFGFCTIFFLSYTYPRLVLPYDSYFAFCPIRWIVMYSLLFYTAYYTPFISKKYYYLSFVLFSLAILWNPEVGILSYITLIAYYCFYEIKNQDIKTIIINCIKIVVTAIVITIVVFLLYTLIIKLFYGNFPNIIKMFSTISVFSSIGMGMLPMPKTYHPYFLIVCINLIGFMLSINNILQKNITPKTAFIFILSLFGLLFFVYYLGRSHNWNLFVSNPFAIVLLTIFANDLISNTSIKKTFFPLFAVIVFLISFSFIELIYNQKKIIDLVEENDNKDANQLANDAVYANADFIKANTTPNEKILILSPTHFQSLYHVLSNTYSAINPGFIEMFFKTDYNIMIQKLLSENIKVFFEPKDFRLFDSKVLAVLGTCYHITKTNGKIYFFEKNNENKNARNLLQNNSTNTTVLHQIMDAAQLFNSNSKYFTGTNNGIVLNKQFTVEVVFKPNPNFQNPFTQSATIFSNIDSKKGMILKQNDSIQDQYVFGFNSSGIISKIDLSKWNYLAYQIDNNKITYYLNGSIAGMVNTPNTYENSTQPLYIGSQNSFPGYYFGQIKELKISNGIINQSEFVSNWQAMQSELTK